VRRRGALALGAALLALGVWGAPSARAEPALSYACSSGSAPTSCTGWHTVPVTLTWTVSASGSAHLSGDCSTRTFAKDAASLTVWCQIDDGGTTLRKTVTLQIDTTPPTITTATPSRPADHAGWWNHPVTLGLGGTDATSGLESCDTVTYSGPDNPAGRVTGSCRDWAGNSAVRSFPIPYDATPPTLAHVKAGPGYRRVTLSWRMSRDTQVVDVMRTPGVRGAPTTELYRGLAARFSDAKASNGTAYRYTVSALDAAGNAATVTVNATPGGLAPATGARVRRPPTLRWQRIAHARYYNVQLFRGRQKILSAWPAQTRLRLHRHGTFHGHRFTLGKGRYRWYVWPGFGARAIHHYGALIGQSSFRMIRR
jgi:hypothetical protein